MYKRGKQVETESTLEVDQVQGVIDKWGVITDRCGIPFRDDETVLKLIGLVIAKLCEYTKKH